MDARSIGGTLPRALAALAALAAASCGDTLLDHSADPSLLGPICADNEVACGGNCLTCSAPQNGVPACVAGGCGFTCVSGYNACGGPACIQESATRCGAVCRDCTAGLPAHATGSCSAALHACQTACEPGWFRSGSACAQATAVSAGFLHTCALLTDRTVVCWGANGRGQLGTGDTTDALSPRPVSLAGPAGAVVAGYDHTCAIVDRSGAGGAAGEVWCWGDNVNGEAGNGSAAPLEPTPVQVVGLSAVQALGAGDGGLTSTPSGHTCAILADGSLRCWGANNTGQVGNGVITLSEPTPVVVSVLPVGVRAVAVTGGEGHTCAITGGGAVYCWGANDKGQLGIGSAGDTGNLTAPLAVTIASGAVQLASGDLHTCALVGTTVTCWGYNFNGQVDPTTASTVPYTSPHATGGLGGNFQAAVLGAGRAHTCAQKAGAGELPKCFGDNGLGQLGNQPGNPVDVPLSPSAQMLTGGQDHTCALTAGGVQCWGANAHGQLGRGTNTRSEIVPGYVWGQ